jgi:hypothetical protein
MVLGVACVAALCVNPAGVHAFAYYAGVAHNMAAQRGEGMWGMLTPLSISGALVVAASVALVLRSSRRRPRGWEVVVALLLTAMTVHAARSSVWLLFALVAPAAAGARAGAPWRMRRVLAAGVALASLAVAIGRGPAPSGASAPLVHEAIERAAGSPILASDIGAEQIALAGGRVWLSDPIDAFGRGAQAAYLDFLDGRQSGLRAAGEAVKSVLVERGSPEARLMDESPEFVLAGHDGTYLLFTRRSAAPNL